MTHNPSELKLNIYIYTLSGLHKKLVQPFACTSNPQGSGGYSGFQVVGMIEGFFGGLKFLIAGFFSARRIWQVFWGGGLI